MNWLNIWDIQWEPISLSLLSLEFLIPYNTCRLIYADIVKLIEVEKVHELRIEYIRLIMSKHYSQAKDFSDLMICAFIKAIAKCWLPEFRPLLHTLH